jgi:hypothetical protein
MNVSGEESRNPKGYGLGGDPWREMTTLGEPDAVKVARPVRRGESRNLHIVGGIVVKHPEDKQGTRLLPNRTFAQIVTSGQLQPRWGEQALATQQVLDALLCSARQDSSDVAVGG